MGLLIVRMEPKIMAWVKVEIDQDVKTLPILAPELEQNEDRTIIVRLYRWLWAAKFFKTLALARTAIEHGKVLINNEIANPGKEINIGTSIQIIQGKVIKTIVVKSLSTKRGAEPYTMYDEKNDFIPQNEFEFNHNGNHTLEASQKSKRPVRFLRRNTSYQREG